MNRLTVNIANACLEVMASPETPAVTLVPEGARLNSWTAANNWLRSVDGLGQVDLDRLSTTISGVVVDSGRLPVGLWVGSTASLRSAVEASRPVRFNVSEFNLAITALKEESKIIQVGAGSGRFLIIYDLNPLRDEVDAQDALTAAQPEPDRAEPDRAEPDQPEPEQGDASNAMENLSAALAEATGTESVPPQEAPMTTTALDHETYYSQHNELVRRAVEAARAGRHNQMHDHMVALLRLRHAYNTEVLAAEGENRAAQPETPRPVTEPERLEVLDVTTTVESDSPAATSEVAVSIQPQSETVSTTDVSTSTTDVSTDVVEGLMACAERQLAELSNTIASLRSALRATTEENYILKRATWQ